MTSPSEDVYEGAGTGYFDSRETAAKAALASGDGRGKVRVVKVVRSMEFFDPEPEPGNVVDATGASLGAA